MDQRTAHYIETIAVKNTTGMNTPRNALPSRSGWLVAGSLLALLSLQPTLGWGQTTPEVVTRTTQYTYDPVTGQVLTETIEPGSDQCVQTTNGYDSFGNKQRIDVAPCSTTSAVATFAARWVTNEFTASTDPANLYPAGAYQTRTQSGSGSTTLSEATAVYDARFGTASTQTEVARSDSSRNLSKRTEYDGFGRVLKEYTPAKRNADGSLSYNRVEYSYVYCQGPSAVSSTACLTTQNLPPQTLTVSYPSQRLTDSAGNATTTATITFVTAYYVESTPYDASGNVLGAKSRVHYDLLNREIAKETQAYDGRWVRTLKGYDQLGTQVAEWGAHYASDVGTAAFDDVRKWTVALDLLHRPVEQHQFARLSAGGTRYELRALARFNGLETSAVVPGDSTPDGADRAVVTRKNGAGQTTQTLNADKATLNMAYDAVGNLIRTVDALGNTTTINFTPGTARFKISMTDPDQGTWSYAYDALGQLKSQTDARGKTTTMAYDGLGRLIAKNTDSFNASWFYDKTEAGVVCAYGLNRLCGTKGGNVTAVSSEQVEYDPLGRAYRTTSNLDRAYVSESSFDDQGRVSTTKYPTGFTLKYAYSNGSNGRTPGVLEQVIDNANSARVFWRIDTMTASQVFDAKGHLLKAQLGNGVSLTNTYDPITGKAFAFAAGTTATPNVFSHTYTYDKAYNMASRTDVMTGVVESFVYDVLERLTQYTLSSAADAGAGRTVNVQYNALGNILLKGDVGGYTYSATDKPHAVRNAGGNTYSYDANGNITGSTGVQSRTNTWTDFNLPQSMSLGSNRVDFLYDANYKRVKEVTTAGGTVRTLYLMHPDNVGGLGFEREETRVNGTLTRNESRHYITVGGNVIAVVKTLNDVGTVSSDASLTNYWHKDSLNSIVAVTDANGAVLERMAFDAWGRRLRYTGRVDPSVDPVNGNRGLTGHEHLDEIGLIHMNGRVYDPVLGRFLSPDSIIEGPEVLQSYNRYSYVWNNPLKYTDPSGHCGPLCFAIIFVVGYEMTQHGNSYWQMAGMFMMAYAGQQLVEAGLGNAVAMGNNVSAFVPANTFNVGGLGNSFLAGAISNFAVTRDPIQAAFSGSFAMAFTTVGGRTEGLERMTLHALLGCAQSFVSGGKCGPSAAAAFVGKGATEVSGADPVVTLLAGGTASVIGGGKFSSGVAQAGFGYLFNSLAHPDNTFEAGVKQAILRGDVAELQALLGNGTLSAQDAVIAQRALAAMQSVGAENSAMLASRYGVDWVNKVGHIFEGVHQGPVGEALLGKFGSPIEAMAQVQRALEVAKPSTSLFSNTFQTTVNVQGVAVQVRGALVDGVYKIGTILKW